MFNLIGKTIQNIEIIGDYDYFENEERVAEVTKITCTDGTELYLFADGGDGNFYTTLIAKKGNPIK